MLRCAAGRQVQTCRPVIRTGYSERDLLALALLVDDPRAAGQGQQSHAGVQGNTHITGVHRLNRRFGRSGATAGRPAGGFLRPMCVNRGIFGKHSVLCDLIAADYRGIPAVESVAAARSGRQRSQLAIFASLGGICGSSTPSSGIKGNGVAGCRDCTGFQYTLALGAFLILCTVSGSRCFGVGDPVAFGMSCFAVFNDDATANNRTFFSMVIRIRLPIGRSMTSCPNDHAGLVGNFHRTGCVLKPLITAVTCVICFVARCGASCRIFINKRQIMGMRNGIIIGTDIADVIVSVIMSRFVFL